MSKEENELDLQILPIPQVSTNSLFAFQLPSFSISFMIIIRSVVMIIAALLAWRCNGDYSFIPRVLFALLAAIFAELYIIFYFVYRVLMGNECNVQESQLDELVEEVSKVLSARQNVTSSA